MSCQVAILLIEGVFTSGALGLADVLSTANRMVQREGLPPVFAVRLLSGDGQPVRASAGVLLNADGSWAEASVGDLLLLPGVTYASLAAFEARLGQEPALLSCLRRWYDGGARIGAACTGVALLAESGVLDGRAATVSWWLTRWFSRRYPQVHLSPLALLTEDGLLHCSGATTAYLNLALVLVERYAGVDVALRCARQLLVDPRRASQAPYATLPDFLGHADPLVARAQGWLQEHLGEPVGVAMVAQAMAVSERTLLRRFRQALDMTPLAYLQTLRLAAARRLLESTGLGLDDVVSAVGYSDPAAFRRLFLREFVCTPGEYRRRFAFGRREAPAAGFSPASFP